MYKLCFALAFLAVAAAKPNWPLTYPSPYPVPSVYPAGAFPVHQPYLAPASTYPAGFSASLYSAPAFSPYPVFGKAYAPAVANSYSNVYTTPVKPIATAPVAAAAVPAVATTYAASVAPVAPLQTYTFGSPATFAWKK